MSQNKRDTTVESVGPCCPVSCGVPASVELVTTTLLRLCPSRVRGSCIASEHSPVASFGPARWSQRTFLLSLLDGIAIELRERSPRQASQFQDKARHLASSASIGAYRRPTVGLGPMSVSPHSCSLVVCAGSATSCRSLLDLAVSKRLL